MRATYTHPDSGLTLDYEIHPALADLDDIHGMLDEILSDVAEDYEQFKQAAYEHYRHAGHAHADANKWATVVADGILPRSVTKPGVPW